MTPNFQFFFYFCIVLFQVSSQLQHANQTNVEPHRHHAEKLSPVNVTVLWEVMCPASVNFMLKQLEPAAKAFPPEILNINLVPYGNAEATGAGGYRLRCQHGPRECFGNKVHACVGALYPGREGVLLSTCIVRKMRNTGHTEKEYARALRQCWHMLSMTDLHKLRFIKRCINGIMGNAILKQFGDETKQLTRGYVPYILVDFNGSRKEVRSNLVKNVCALLDYEPSACGNYRRL